MNSFLKNQGLFFSVYFVIFLNFLLMPPQMAFTQDHELPDDLTITLTSGPVQPGHQYDIETALIKPDGTTILSPKYVEDEILPEIKIKLTRESLISIYDAIKRWKFFELKPFYEDPSVIDGDYASLRVTANGVTHEVKTQNIKVHDFDRITWRINSELPDDRMILYNVFYGVKSKEMKR